MIRPIMKNEIFLRRPSEITLPSDADVARDLLDTYLAHKDECAGMAANMIGVRKRIIVFDDRGTPLVMLNPEVIGAFREYETREGCLSLEGTRPAVRYHRVKVRYQDLDMVEHVRSFTGFTAQVVQHEIDHCDGIVI